MITGLCDEYPKLLGRHRELFVLGLLIFIYVCALPTTTYVSFRFLFLFSLFRTLNENVHVLENVYV